MTLLVAKMVGELGWRSGKDQGFTRASFGSFDLKAGHVFWSIGARLSFWSPGRAGVDDAPPRPRGAGLGGGCAQSPPRRRGRGAWTRGGRGPSSPIPRPAPRHTPA